MYKKLFIPLVAACVISMTSCKQISVVPQATNTTAVVSFKNLNLERNDYIVLNTISAEATITAHFGNKDIRVDDPTGEFSVSWKWEKSAKGKDRQNGKWVPSTFRGIVRLGYLSNDYDNELFELPPYPHWIVRRLAIYRLINAAKIAGGDAIIEPTISTNVEQGRSRHDIIYKTTVSAKVVKIKTNSK